MGKGIDIVKNILNGMRDAFFLSDGLSLSSEISVWNGRLAFLLVVSMFVTVCLYFWFFRALLDGKSSDKGAMFFKILLLFFVILSVILSFIFGSVYRKEKYQFFICLSYNAQDLTDKEKALSISMCGEKGLRLLVLPKNPDPTLKEILHTRTVEDMPYVTMDKLIKDSLQNRLSSQDTLSSIMWWKLGSWMCFVVPFTLLFLVFIFNILPISRQEAQSVFISFFESVLAPFLKMVSYLSRGFKWLKNQILDKNSAQ